MELGRRGKFSRAPGDERQGRERSERGRREAGLGNSNYTLDRWNIVSFARKSGEEGRGQMDERGRKKKSRRNPEDSVLLYSREKPGTISRVLHTLTHARAFIFRDSLPPFFFCLPRSNVVVVTEEHRRWMLPTSPRRGSPTANTPLFGIPTERFRNDLERKKERKEKMKT